MREINEALAKDPRHFKSMVIKSDILAAKQDIEALRQVLQVMQESYPDSPEGYFRMGRVYRSEGKPELALAEYDKALALTSGHGEVQMLSEIINTEMSVGEVDKAEQRLKAIIAKDEMHPIAYDLLGMVYLNQKRYQDAEAAFVAQIRINPNNNTVYSQLASARVAQGNLNGALAAYQDGLKLMPDDLRLLIGMASIEEQRENYAEAIRVYEQVLAKAPNNAVATNNLAALLIDHGQDDQSLEKAKALAEKLVKIQQPAFQDTVGWVYYKAGQYDQAVQVLQGVVEKMPEVSVFQYHLGMASYKKGDVSAAKAHLTKALELGEFPGMDQAREVLVKLP